jgi:putative NIF3 family GTP cyclohydrolase 1 type 2
MSAHVTQRPQHSGGDRQRVWSSGRRYNTRMRVADIVEHFLCRASWIDRGNTVDRVIVGDPEAEVARCVVTWMPTMSALEEMVGRGITFMVCHEPAFWNHHDQLPEGDSAIAQKLAFVRRHGLTIVRNHDCWDRWPEIGIPWAWGQHLGFEGRPVAVGAKGYQHRYDIAPLPLGEFARRVAKACAVLGEPAVQVTGKMDQIVSRIGVGTGCACDIGTFIEMGCDLSIVCDDGSCYWKDIQRAREIGHPVVRVNHGTSEEPGMVTLTRYLNTQLDGLVAEHLPHGSIFSLVGEVREGTCQLVKGGV